MEKINVNGDKLSVQIDGAYTAEEARKLLERIGEARSKIANDPDSPEGVPVVTARQPRWFTQFDLSMHPFLNVLFRHPYYGWVGATFALGDVTNINTSVAQYIHAIATSAPTGTPDATAAPKGQLQ